MVLEKIIGAKKDKYPPSRQLKTKYGIVEGRRLIHGEPKEVGFRLRTIIVHFILL